MFHFKEILMNGTMAMALAAVGLGFVVITGGFDLSVGASMVLVNCILTTQLTESLWNQFFWCVICLGIGLGAGLANGWFVAFLRLPSIIVTLASMFILGGCSLIILPVPPPTQVPQSFINFWTGDLAGILPNAFILLIIVIVVLIFIRKSYLGIGIFAIGSDADSAYMNGIPVIRTKLLAYTIAGGFYALAGIFLTAITGSGDPTIGTPLTLQTFAAVVVGGTPLGGGKGSFIGNILGAAIMNLSIGVLFVVGVSSYWGPIFNGVVLVLAVLAIAQWLRVMDRYSIRMAGGSTAS
jgi:ribose transport system permease protein